MVQAKDMVYLLIKQIPTYIDEKIREQKYPVMGSYMNGLLAKECEAYNYLLNVIYISLRNTLKALEGTAVLNETLESVSGSVLNGEIPEAWLKYSYPIECSLSDYLDNLKRRVDFFKLWVKTERFVK